MLSGWFNHKKPVNLIIKDHVVRFLELKSTEPIVVKSFLEQSLPEGVVRHGRIMDEEKLLSILEQCIGEMGIKGRDVRFTVPDPSVIIRRQLVPSDVKDDEIKGFLYMELGSSIHLPFENPVFDFKVIGSKEDKKEILLFAAPEEVVIGYSNLLGEVKLKPAAADITPLCMYRLFDEKGLTNPQNHYLLIQFDVQTVNVSIFHNDYPVFMRHMEMEVEPLPSMTLGDAAQTEELEAKMGDIFVEIGRIINYYRYSLNQGKAEITHILLSGDQPEMDYVMKQSEEQFDLRVIRYDGSDVQAVHDLALPDSFHLPLGLALKEVR